MTTSISLQHQLLDYIRACFAGLWIVSHEHDEALRELTILCREQDWTLAVWDIDRGLELVGSDASNGEGAADPLAAVRALDQLADPQRAAILALPNFHRFLGSPEIVQALARQIALGKQRRSFVVVLAPVVQIPPELEKLFVVVEHRLPDRAQLAEIARGVATEPGELPEGHELERVLDAAAGLTRYEAEGAFALSLVRRQRLEPESLWDHKAQALLKNGLLELHRNGPQFDTLGGLSALKSFCLRALRPRSTTSPESGERPLPRGLLLLGVPGTGKSQFCKALGRETGRPTLRLDVGALMGSLVGQTEQRTRQALAAVDAMAPAVLMIDEVEKALAGGAGSSNDSGVAQRLLGALLTWLNDHASDVFVVCTANDVSKLPPEFSRAERFDGVFFLDLPDAAQKRAIWEIYRQRFGVEPSERQPDDAGWTGAEIRACCRLAALLDVPLAQAAQNVVPVSATAAEAVERLRSWASGRCLSAEQPGVYRRPAAKPARRRPVDRDPSVN